MMASAMANLVSLKHSRLALVLLSIFLSSSRLGKAQNTSPETATAAAGVLQNEYYPGTGGTGAGGSNQGNTGAGGSNQGNPGYLPGAGGSNEENPEYFPGKGGSNQGNPGYLPGTGESNEENPEYFPGKGGAGGGSEEDPDHIVTQALLCFNEKQIYSSCSEAFRLSEHGDLHVPPEHTDEYCHSPCISETNLVLHCIETVLSHFKFYNKATINDIRETIKEGCSYGPQRGDFNVAEHIQEENSAEKSWKSSSLFLHGMLLMILLGSHLWL